MFAQTMKISIVAQKIVRSAAEMEIAVCSKAPRPAPKTVVSYAVMAHAMGPKPIISVQKTVQFHFLFVDGTPQT
jgi:hypothetical protein